VPTDVAQPQADRPDAQLVAVAQRSVLDASTVEPRTVTRCEIHDTDLTVLLDGETRVLSRDALHGLRNVGSRIPPEHEGVGLQPHGSRGRHALAHLEKGRAELGRLVLGVLGGRLVLIGHAQGW